MPRIYPLFSSSQGNSTYVGTKDAGILIDCGVSFRRLCHALEVNGLSPEAVKAVFITHEHTDHTAGLKILTKYAKTAVFAQKYTLAALYNAGQIDAFCHCEEIDCEVEVCGITVECFQTPHDAMESCGYRISFQSGKVCAVCTDLGHVNKTVEGYLLGADAVLIESNYDEKMLKNGPYPWFLKKRIMSQHGHLSNTDCAEFAAKLVDSGTTRLILGHLSQQNNTPEAAAFTMESGLPNFKRGSDYILSIAPVQTSGGFVAF